MHRVRDRKHSLKVWAQEPVNATFVAIHYFPYESVFFKYD
jgi:hypothetical protein